MLQVGGNLARRLFGLKPDANASRSSHQRTKLTITGPEAGIATSSATCTQGSSISLPFLSSGINVLGIELLFEWFEADAAVGVEEALAIAADIHEGFDNCLDRIDHVLG